MTNENDKVKHYYNKYGNVEKFEVWRNNVRVLEEDLSFETNLNGFISKRSIANFDVGFEYDVLGNQTKLTDQFGLAVNYTYNDLNQLDYLTVENKNFDYEYYDDGTIKAIQYPTLNNGSVLRSENTYDNINRLTTVINKIGNQIISQFDYEYDNNGNITRVIENKNTGNEVITDYQYDELNRLDIITRPNNVIVDMKYDTRGNRKEIQTNTRGSIDYLHKYNKDSQYTYNSWDELSEFTIRGDTYHYKYDAEGLRIKKITPNKTIRYHHNNSGEVIAESDENDQIIAQNIWGFRPLARKVNGEYYYYICNARGDIVQLVDEDGNVVNHYRYDEWGNTLEKQEQIENPIRYAAEYYDEESGLYYLRARYYEPTTGRFISKDTYEGTLTNPLTLNLYTYCLNNPIRYLDPTGHYVSDFDKEHCTPSEIEDLDRYTKEYEAGDKTAHDRAEAIRDKYRTDNEIGTPEGKTIDKRTGKESSRKRSKTVTMPDGYSGGWNYAPSYAVIEDTSTVTGYGGSLSVSCFIGFEVSVYGAKDKWGNWGLFASVGAKAGTTVEVSGQIIRVMSYDAVDVNQARGLSSNILNVGGGHIVYGNYSISKSRPDEFGKQTTWHTTGIGGGSGAEFGASPISNTWRLLEWRSQK